MTRQARLRVPDREGKTNNEDLSFIQIYGLAAGWTALLTRSDSQFPTRDNCFTCSPTFLFVYCLIYLMPEYHILHIFVFSWKNWRKIYTDWILRLTYLEVCFSSELELNRLPYTNPADLTTRLLLDLMWRGRKDIDDLVCQAVGHCTSLSMREIINHNRLDSAGWSKYFIRIKVSKVEKPNKVTLLFPTYSQCSTTSQNDLK